VNAELIIVGSEQGSNGTVTITGANSLVETADRLEIGADGTGTVTVANDGRLVVGNGASVGQDGTLTGDGTLIGYVANVGGTIAPGLSTGTLMIEGDSFMSDTAELEIEIGGLNPGEFDVLDVTGATHLSGVLKVSLFEGFTPEIGDTFDIILASLFSGEFDNVMFPVFDGLTFDVLYETDLVQLSVRAVPIPAAVWLFGSGLLGLIGMARRKRSV
jgi:T5SS/PEP-CTERM-associated repeat protein